MTKEIKPLDEKRKTIGYDKIDLYTKVYPEKDVKNLIKQVQEELKEEIFMLQNCNPKISDEVSLEINEEINKIIDTIFKQRFGSLAK